MTKAADAPAPKDKAKQGLHKPDQQKRREAVEALRARHAEKGDSTPAKQMAGDHARQSSEHTPGKDLAKDLVKGGKTVTSFLKFATKDSNLTRIEQTMAQGSKLIGQTIEKIQTSGLSDKAVQGAVAVGDKVQGALSQPAGERLRNLGNSTGLKWAGRGLSTLNTTIEAHQRGEGWATAGVEGLTVTAVTEKVKDLAKNAGKIGTIDAVVNTVHTITKKISPRAAEYTGIAADMTPSQVATQFTKNAVETYSALARRDGDRVIQQQEKMLHGEFGEVVRGYAIVSETAGALVTRDTRALNHLSDMAAGGKLGKLAWLGDRIGEGVFDLLH